MFVSVGLSSFLRHSSILSGILTVKLLLNTIYSDFRRLGGLGVTSSPRDPRFVGSNPAEVDEFFEDVKVVREGIEGVGSESEISGSLNNLLPEKIGL